MTFLMSDAAIASASIERLNARREEMVNAYGMSQAHFCREWHLIESEIAKRGGYVAYSQLVDAYSRYIAQYQPQTQAVDGQ
jgi:hypothetical protein